MKSIHKLLLTASLAILVASCGKHEEAPKDTGAISEDAIRNAQTATVATEQKSDIVKLNGKVEANETKLAKVYALVSGKIQSANVELGDYVHKGQVLAVLQSTEVAGVSSDLAAAEGNIALTSKSLQTTKELYEGKLATEQDYISAKVAYNRAKAELAKARQISSISGGRNATYTLTAPIAGYVIEKNITGNSAVRSDNNTALFAIADLSNVWITANVYEADMSAIHLGDSVAVTTLAKPDKSYTGTIDKIYNVLDPATRTMKVRISMNNANGELKPEMFATVRVSGKPSGGTTLAIPSGAIVMDNSRNYVVVRTGKTLQVREINLIDRTEGKAYITGLRAGDQVVTSGQVFFYQALTKQ